PRARSRRRHPRQACGRRQLPREGRLPHARPSVLRGQALRNFPDSRPRHGLPTIQGAVMLSDAANGAPLAIMDSIAITALRTVAAARWQRSTLRETRAQTALIVGCGGQARAQLSALMRVAVYD